MSTRIGLAMMVVGVLGACREQQMAKVMDVDMAPGASQGPGASGSTGPVATALAAQLSAAGLDVTNLPALEDVPDAKIIPVMEAFATALGAQCSDCHVEDKSADTPRKRVATKMWDELARALARPDGSPIFCDSCHQGKITFLDRSDDQALASFMQASYVDGVRRKDGTTQTCANCHGNPFDPSFLDGWEVAADGGTDAGDGGVLATDGSTPIDLASTPDAATAPCSLSVNEVQTGSSKSASDEFIELYSSCTTATSLAGYRLVYRSGAGTTDTLLVKLDGLSVPASGYLVIGNASYSGTAAVTYTPNLAGTAGGVALENGTTVVDSVAWGTATNAFVEGEPAHAPLVGESIARQPDGSHAHASQAIDLVAGVPTPGAAN